MIHLKYKLTIGIIFLIGLFASAQNDSVELGAFYQKYHDMDYQNYKKSDHHLESIISYNLFERKNENDFHSFLARENRTLYLLYDDDLESLAEEFSELKKELPYSVFDDRTEKAHTIMLAFLEKFRIISQYYHDLNKLRDEKQANLKKRDEFIEQKIDSLKASFENRKAPLLLKIDSNKNLLSSDPRIIRLQQERKSKVEKAISDYENKVAPIAKEYEEAKDTLSPKNYTENKIKLAKKYEIRLLRLYQDKESHVNDIISFYDDKQRSIEKKIMSKIRKSNDSLNQRLQKIKMEYEIARKELKSKLDQRNSGLNEASSKSIAKKERNLNQNFENRIKLIDAKIKKAKERKVKKSLFESFK